MKFFISLIVFTGFLFSYDVSIYKKEFSKSFWDRERKWEETPLLKKAISLLEDEKQYLTDSIVSRQYGTKSFKMPNYKKAFELLMQSAKKEKNLASMFLALKIKKYIFFEGNKRKRKKGQEQIDKIASVMAKKLLSYNNCYGGIVYYSLNDKVVIPLKTLKKMQKGCDMSYATAVNNLKIEREDRVKEQKRVKK